MYMFCYQRGLREVWGYMWANWYSPEMWKLWARSTSELLTRLRTTMNVENHWRQLKHRFLKDYARPRLDLLVWILISKVTKKYYERIGMLDDLHRAGRPKSHSAFQAALKKEWRKLSKAKVSARAYKTDLKTFTCTCGQQKYHSHHLCKHLVQAATVQPIFFLEIYRRRVKPLYKHLALNHSLKESDFDDGSITEGDDSVLHGDTRYQLSGGRWRDMVDSAKGKGRASSPPPEAISSSPEPAFAVSSSSPPMRPSDAIQEGEAEEKEVRLESRAKSFREAAEFLEQELDGPDGPNGIWMKSIVRRQLGRDVVEFATNCRIETETGRKRGTTWAQGKGKKAKRRAADTMGLKGRKKFKSVKVKGVSIIKRR
ncbi:hypothetical protein BKA70DRAFT_1131754 [Coprinopsis sp. MPI-PUGE-AT-0042]|nr:hypothetical protein BKA70DRAFT_1131754 [Coprinopsis sp. MPI-PUGE-AT-0042]